MVDNKIYPRKLNGVKSYDLWDEVVLYSPKREMAFSLNNSAKSVWELCDGQQTVAEICQELGHRFQCQGETLLPDVEVAIAELVNLGLIEWEEASLADPV